MPAEQTKSIIQYGNDNGGTAAQLSYNVPLPSSHSGRRIVELQLFINPEHWVASLSKMAKQTDFLHRFTPKQVPQEKIQNLAFQLWKSSGRPMGKQDEFWGQAEDKLYQVNSEENWYDLARNAGITNEDLAILKRYRNNADKFEPEVPKYKRNRIIALKDILEDYKKRLHLGEVVVPVKLPGDNIGTTVIELPVRPNTGSSGEPVSVKMPTGKFFLIEKWGISSFLGKYGVGKTVKTLTLLPGESMTIKVRTWRATSSSTSEGSSIIDSQENSTAANFGEKLQSETTDRNTRSKKEDWKVEAKAEASWGWGKAEVSGGASGESQSAREQFAKDAKEATEEHAKSASNKRQNTVTSSSEQSQKNEDETVTERVINNVNMRRTLNYVFRELNQEYVTKIHLQDIRIGYTDGSSPWREVPLSGLRKLLGELIVESEVPRLFIDIISQTKTIYDINDEPVNFLQKLTIQKNGDIQKQDVNPGDSIICSHDSYYRVNRENNGYLNQKDKENKVPGVLMSETKIVMRTDSLIVEALLGQTDALDDYADRMQKAAAKSKELDNERVAIANENNSLVTQLLSELKASGISVEQKIDTYAKTLNKDK